MLRTYSFFPKKAVTAYDVQKAWRARQAAYNDVRLNTIRAATSSIYSTSISQVQQIGDLAVKQAVRRMTAGVDIKV